MIIYFCIYSFLGYIMESCYVSLFQKKFISSGLLKGPYIPLYGFGALVLILLSPYLHHSLFLTFFIGGLAMTLVEYVSSIYIEKVFHTQCWNYSHHFCQFQGRICLVYYVIWSFLSYLFIYYIHPFFISFIPINDFLLIFALLFTLLIVKDTVKRLNTQKNSDLIIKKESL